VQNIMHSCKLGGGAKLAHTPVIIVVLLLLRLPLSVSLPLTDSLPHSVFFFKCRSLSSVLHLLQCVYTIRMPLRDFLATWGLLIVRPTLSSIDRHLPLRDFFGASRSSLSSFNRFASSVVDRLRDRLHLLVVGVGRCHPTFTFVVSTSALWVALVFTCCHLGLLLCLRRHRTVGTFLAALLGLTPRLG